MKRCGGWIAVLLLAGCLGAGGVARSEVPAGGPELETVELPDLRLMALDPEWSDLIRAQSLMKAGSRVEALTVLRGILKRDVRDAAALTMVATILTELGRQREALQLFEQLARQNAKDYVVLNNLAWLLATAAEPTLRDPAQALEWARQAILLAPDNFSVWSTLSEAYYRNGRYDRALRAAQLALQLAGDQQADGPRLATYAEQVQKCQEATAAFSLLDP